MSDWTFRHWYVPARMLDGLRRYAEHGIQPGDFLSAVIKNDFMEACHRADDENLANLPAYAAYLYNEMPGGCHGSPEIMRCWIDKFKARAQPTLSELEKLA